MAVGVFFPQLGGTFSAPGSQMCDEIGSERGERHTGSGKRVDSLHPGHTCDDDDDDDDDDDNNNNLIMYGYIQ